MTLNLQLPPDLEARLEAEASRVGISLPDYAIQTLSAIETWSVTNKAPSALTLAEVIHSLAERTLALEATTSRKIESEPGQRERYESLYQLLERRTTTGEMQKDQIEELLGFLLREIDLYRNYLANFLGAWDSEAPLKARKRPVDIILLIRSVIDLFMFKAQEKGVNIVCDDLMPTVLLPLDFELTQRLLINILDNAVKYSYSSFGSAGRRHIVVVVRRHNFRNDYAISVESYGVGILEEELLSDKIFKYGTRGRLSADRERRGTGIGLAEAKRIVEAHGGHIHIRSAQMTEDAYLTRVTVVFVGT